MIDACAGKREREQWRMVSVVRDGGRGGGVAVARVLERRILALEDAHAAVQAELADLARANREATGLLVDVAGPARRVIAFVDGKKPA